MVISKASFAVWPGARALVADGGELEGEAEVSTEGGGAKEWALCAPAPSPPCDDGNEY